MPRIMGEAGRHQRGDEIHQTSDSTSAILVLKKTPLSPTHLMSNLCGRSSRIKLWILESSLRERVNYMAHSSILDFP